MEGAPGAISGPAPINFRRVPPTIGGMDPFTLQYVLLFGVPLGAIVLSALGLHYMGTPLVRRVSTAAISTQVVLTGAAFALLETLPREINWSGAVGDTCPRMEGVQGLLVGIVFLVSIGVAAIALASGVIVVRRHAGSAWRILGGIGTCLLVFVILVGIIGTALCGMN